MLSEEKTMEVLEFYDLTGSYRSAAALAGVDHQTVRAKVAARAAGLDATARLVRAKVTDAYADKIRELIDRSQGRIHADRVHEKLQAMGYGGSERTTRRVVEALKAEWRRDHARSYKPWIPEPGLWLQWDYGEGPMVEGTRAVLFSAWLAWSRFRVVLALRDRTLASVVAALDATFRVLGGAPTYALTDNERTVSEKHIARIAVRNPKMVSAAVYYGITIATCVPFDPESKGGRGGDGAHRQGGSGADRGEPASRVLGLGRAGGGVRGVLRPGQRPGARHHPSGASRGPRGGAPAAAAAVPAEPYTAAFGESRAVSWSQTVSFRGARYSVPPQWRNLRVWVRVAGDEVRIVGEGDGGLTEVARHPLRGPGEASIADEHYPNHPTGPLDRRPEATNGAEAAFLAIGKGAAAWLIEAAAVGTRRIEVRMAEAVELARANPAERVDEALGLAAMAGRFGPGDLGSILAARRDEPRRASSEHSLQPGTAAWEGFGR